MRVLSIEYIQGLEGWGKDVLGIPKGSYPGSFLALSLFLAYLYGILSKCLTDPHRQGVETEGVELGNFSIDQARG